MENSVKKVVKAKKKSKIKFKVLGIFKATVEETVIATIKTDAPDFIQGVYSSFPDDIVEDVLPTDLFDDEEDV